MEKRRNLSERAVSQDLFFRLLSTYLKLHESNCILIYEMWLFDLFFPQYRYVEIHISRIISGRPFDFEITRIDCIKCNTVNDPKYTFTLTILALKFKQHNENMSIQIYRKFHLQKTEHFQIKKTLIFFIFLLKTYIVGTR